MGSYRVRDMETERIISQYIDKYLYSDSKFTKATRTDCKEEQLSGSDIIISVPSYNIYNAIVDEKASTHFLTKSLPTFALELSFISQKGEIIEGWFTDSNKKTEYYLLMWPHANKDWNIEFEDIEYIDYTLVKRSDILNWLKTEGYTTTRLREKAHIIRNEISENGPIDKTYNKDFYFYLTTKLAEKPINIIIKRKVYEKLAILKGRI